MKELRSSTFAEARRSLSRITKEMYNDEIDLAKGKAVIYGLNTVIAALKAEHDYEGGNSDSNDMLNSLLILLRDEEPAKEGASEG